MDNPEDSEKINCEKEIQLRCTQLLDNYDNILKSAKINSKVQNLRESHELETRAKNIVTAGNDLFDIITELKYAVFLNDFEAQNKEVEESKDKYNQLNRAALAEITSLKKEVDVALVELETAYY